MSSAPQRTSVSSAAEGNLALLVQGICVISVVQFIVKVNTLVYVCSHRFYVQTLSVHWCDLWCLPLEVDHYFLCCTGVYTGDCIHTT